MDLIKDTLGETNIRAINSRIFILFIHRLTKQWALVQDNGLSLVSHLAVDTVI